MTIIQNPAVTAVFDNYTPEIKAKLLELRQLILDTASEIDSITSIEETLKWGEPSYLVQKGSTIRINRKKAAPTQYAIYFKCTSKLVPTFRELYPTQFNFENNRAIVFDCANTIPTEALKHCITLALTYHRVKHLPLLGA